MKKKLIKIIALLVLSLVGIFCCSNVSATTIYFEDDFDSYIALGPLSEYPNWFLSNGSSPVVSSDNYVSAGNSVKFYYHDGARSAIKHNLNSSLDSFYISADILLPIPTSYQDVSFFGFDVFDESYDPRYNYYKYHSVSFSCIKDTYGSVYGNHSSDGNYYFDNENVDQLCNGSFNNISVHFERDYLNNRTIISSYINGDLVNISYDNLYELGFYDIAMYANVSTTLDGIYLDNFKISDTLLSNDPDPVDATCGSSDRQTYSYPTTLPEDFCATGELITPSLVYDGYGWNWSCSGLYGGESVSCEAYNSLSDPTIDDVIDFDWDDFDYDFEEEDVSKNWLIDIFKFLFLPREQTLQKFFTTFDNFKQKIPFGYIYLIRDKFKEVSLESTDEFALNLELLGEDYEVFSVTSLKQKIGENTFNIFYDIMKALIWIVFALYLIVKVQKLFNNND
jgi:hypothetical protein